MNGNDRGWLRGVREDRFDPITREQLAAVLYRYAQYKGEGFTGAWMFLLDYPDAAEISSWADEAMHWMVMVEVINGMDGRLNPKGGATRAQAAALLWGAGASLWPTGETPHPLRGSSPVRGATRGRKKHLKKRGGGGIIAMFEIMTR